MNFDSRIIFAIRKYCKNLEILSLSGIKGLDEEIFLYFLKEIICGYPNLKFLNLSKIDQIGFSSLSLVNILILTRKMNIEVTSNVENTLEYFNTTKFKRNSL
jgi:hypothetical protein